LLALAEARAPAVWISDGDRRLCAPASQDPAAWPGAFSRRFDPPPRLVVFGGDPTAMAVAGLGAQSGFQTTLIRPKGPTSPPPLPDVAYRRDEVAGAVAAIGLDPWTAVAICGHDEEVDHQALLAALPSAAPYVGLLGARRRLGERLERLRAAGVAERDLRKLRAPIGLDLGGKAPFEVAVAVIGEIMATRHGQPALARRP
jgi:xanthine dehydrogenase accessory factor